MLIECCILHLGLCKTSYQDICPWEWRDEVISPEKWQGDSRSVRLLWRVCVCSRRCTFPLTCWHTWPAPTSESPTQPPFEERRQSSHYGAEGLVCLSPGTKLMISWWMRFFCFGSPVNSSSVVFKDKTWQLASLLDRNHRLSSDFTVLPAISRGPQKKKRIIR